MDRPRLAAIVAALTLGAGAGTLIACGEDRGGVTVEGGSTSTGSTTTTPTTQTTP